MRSDLPQSVTAILGAIVGTALADGKLQDQERTVLRAIVEEFELEEGELAAAFEAGRSLLGGSLDALDGVEKMEVMRYAILAAVADGRIEKSELGFLDDLAKRLKLSAVEQRELEGLTVDLFRATRGGTVDAKKVRRLIEQHVR